MLGKKANFALGQLVWQPENRFRGVVVDVDPSFNGSDAMYQQMDENRPDKDQPWYTVLVDHSEQAVYVAEEYLEADPSSDPVTNPAMGQFLGEMHDGHYTVRQTLN
ncbi:MAG TPA: heat shock protein HspQ [Gammaproteobacteria bacterium]|nr:heat shock protein HspQ [Gammaproteobacteria bacterium]